MGKKRKASGRPSAKPKSFEVNPKDAQLLINTYEDVADSEDEFHLHRDKILLDEGPEAKRIRKWKEEDEFLEPSDEEVLAFESPSEDEDTSEDEEMSDEDEGLEDDITGLPTRKPRQKPNDLDDYVDDEELGEWGPSKRDYYGADVLHTEDDAREEEKEALRTQKKHLQGMTETDFGFDDADWAAADQAGAGETDEAEDVITEVLPQLQVTEDMAIEERLKLLKTRYPEFEPLSKEFLGLQPLHGELLLAANAAETLRHHATTDRSKGRVLDSRVPVAVIKHRALAAYLAAITMYFALLTSPCEADGSLSLARSPLELRDHPVMDGLVKCRQLWLKVKDIPIPEGALDATNELSLIEEEPAVQVEAQAVDTTAEKTKPARKRKKSKAQKAAEAAQAQTEALRAERMRKTEEELAALTALTEKAARKSAPAPKAAKKATLIINEDDSDFGEETELTAHELAEKTRKRKSLRFYTSQIAQKANKRDASSRDAGGDADIPYRERLRDRQARLNAEAERRGQQKARPGEELGGESDEEDRRRAREVRGEDGSDEDDYYDMVAARSKARKTEKQQLHEAQARAAREGGMLVGTEEIGPDGKRKISYAIEKNKGLAPKRKKEVRNPRVKKRKKFEEKTKKLSSIRAVYKGGQGGNYGGEATGIKKNLVKSIKL